MNIAVDEFGNPFIILREQQQKKRLKGLEAHTANILAAKSVATTLRSSLGPKGLDKIIIGSDGDVTVTNDGATILEQMQVDHRCARLLVELSKSQDDQVGDGTTGVVIFVGALLEEALRIIEKGLHPLKIADGFDLACDVAIKRLEAIAVPRPIETNNHDILLTSALTALGSKVVSNQKQHLAKICIDAVLAVADLDRRDVNFDLIKLESNVGGRLEDTNLVKGVVLGKEMSHPQMRKETRDAKIAVLTCPFEPPKPKTKHKLDIKTADEYRRLYEAEQKYFTDMVDKIEQCGANFVICQWGFDDEANHLLMQRNLPAVRWVGGVEIELVAIATGAHIVPRFEDLSPQKLGKAGLIKEITTGTEKDQYIVIEECANSKAVTIVVHGGNKMIVEEAKRSIHDALCCVRNMIRDNRIVPGGGASEVAMGLAVDAKADDVGSVEQYAVRAFGDALFNLPECLAENAGMNAIAAVSELKARQLAEKNPNLGVNVIAEGCADMLGQDVVESFASKKHQVALATQVAKMILKIDDVISPQEMHEMQ